MLSVHELLATSSAVFLPDPIRSAGLVAGSHHNPDSLLTAHGMHADLAYWRLLLFNKAGFFMPDCLQNQLL